MLYYIIVYFATRSSRDANQLCPRDAAPSIVADADARAQREGAVI